MTPRQHIIKTIAYKIRVHYGKDFYASNNEWYFIISDKVDAMERENTVTRKEREYLNNISRTGFRRLCSDIRKHYYAIPY